MCRIESLAFDPQQEAPYMFKPHILCWIWLCSHNRKKTSYAGVYFCCFYYFFVGFPQIISLNIIMFMSLPILFMPLFHYFPITSNLLFFSLNINKASKQHTRVSSISFLRQGTGLRNRCTFALANGLAGIFTSRYWVSLIGFGLCPSR